MFTPALANASYLTSKTQKYKAAFQKYCVTEDPP